MLLQYIQQYEIDLHILYYPLLKEKTVLHHIIHAARNNSRII